MPIVTGACLSLRELFLCSNLAALSSRRILRQLACRVARGTDSTGQLAGLEGLADERDSSSISTVSSGTLSVAVSVVELSVVALLVIALSVVALSVVAMSVVALSVGELSV